MVLHVCLFKMVSVTISCDDFNLEELKNSVKARHSDGTEAYFGPYLIIYD